MFKFLEKLFENFMYCIKNYEYTQCGKFEADGESFYVYMGTHEKYEPHFHVYKERGKHLFKNINNKHFHTCISLLKPEYVNHGFRNGTFNKKEIKSLCDFLESKPSHLRGCTRWEWIVMLWDPENKKNDVYIHNISKPDYSKLL